MSAFDEEIEIEIDEIFKKSNNFGYDLKQYLDNLPEKQLRRAIYILSRHYYHMDVSSEEMFKFIVYMFSDDKIISQVTFDNFAYYFVSMRNFNRVQKYKLKKIVMEKMEILCKNSVDPYNMNTLLNHLFSKQDLMDYLADLIEKLNRINSDFITSFFSTLFYNDYKEVIQYISSIINSNKLVNKLSDEELTLLKRQIL
ncbi:hypothetical protein BGH98_03795 [Snodgrassella alvi]|uniref:hypothetical protein n=3 Tax=Snodgrassella alvi TaxID=1196083 RepID=UPI000A04A225|nr:hypothetical protein [Snodgrassella alvi]ORF07618.1 hypothetical protein BGH98_03795 [Snodgrassella alvi]ORF21417.1 hypothetical protein BGI04_02855 [Snodgrassella alvi]